MEAIAMEQDETLQQAIQKWENMSHNQQFRREYEAREKILLDEKAAVAHAKNIGKQEGLEQGLKQGLEQGKAKIMKQLYDNGMSVQAIADNLQLTVEEVQRMLRLS
ncbi:hypothetical protein CON35_22630 [Bacillus cereus]|nr:hypothetical protein CON35_22630 [Bacillus cereus]